MTTRKQGFQFHFLSTNWEENIMKKILTIVVLAILQLQCESGLLYPRANPVREVVSLDGLWKFSLSHAPLKQIEDGHWSWYKLEENDEDVELMPVPASYNDISTNANVRDHVGVVRYQRNFAVPRSWEGKRIWLRFGSVCYAAEVYINEKLAITHSVGHLPFGLEVTSFVNLESDNNITVFVNNTLDRQSIPQGNLEVLPSGRIKQTYDFDFFNYAGIDRPVVLYTTDRTYIDDITLTTEVRGSSGVVNYNVTIVGNYANYTLAIIDKTGRQVILSYNPARNGSLIISNANLWWPYLMSDQPGYLYTFKVDVFDTNNRLIDRYEQPFGVRQLSWDNTTFKINGQPLYLRGFGRHEDSDIRGKGLDLPLIIRDYNLIQWIGANSYRTSHYPYAEEIMDLADSLGIMILDEVPAVAMVGFGKVVLQNHKDTITTLYNRDKNRPSVVIWSLANEPRSAVNTSEEYFRQIVAHAKSFDNTRPVTVINNVAPEDDHAGQFVDILCFNKYIGWYENAGDLDVIIPDVVGLAEAWHARHNKPVMVTEYGADTLEGYHSIPDFVWSEEFQTDLVSEHFRAFDILRDKGWFIGEQIWNYADFRTKQEFRRVGGNKKGIFTRQRQPKSSAHLMRRRYWGLAETLNNVVPPSDVDNYVVEIKIKDEL